ncbi:MAG: pseudouridine synthase [Cytophagales bacterium]|nr:pseudouridine synthase [Cytophagales bacterium]
MSNKIEFKNIILFEDNDFIVVNKPYGISTLDDRVGNEPNILRLAKAYTADAQVCHRLDKETSGALAIAKNPAAYRHLSMQFENREVVKIYHAVISGIHHIEEDTIDMPLSQSKDGNAKIDFEYGKPSATLIKTLEVYRSHTLLACYPITGRMHQIRIHLAATKRPIVADSLYGGKNIYLSDLKKDYKLKKWTEEQPLMQRVALHAFSLFFKTLNENQVMAEAPYPKDMTALLRQLKLTL